MHIAVHLWWMVLSALHILTLMTAGAITPSQNSKRRLHVLCKCICPTLNLSFFPPSRSEHAVITSMLVNAGFATSILSNSEFAPQNREELVNAIRECLAKSSQGYCTDGTHGPIGDWDVSRVTDMYLIFYYKMSYKADISKWDVSRVTNMQQMFSGAAAFNANLSQWNVSSVTSMFSILFGASAFDADISKWDVSRVTDM